MNARSRLLVGVALLGLAGATFWVAATQADSDVRYVEGILGDPHGHRAGTYTLLGIPEPAAVPRTGPAGLELVPNPMFRNETVHAVRWTLDGQAVHSVHRLRAEELPDGRLRWTFTNRTTLPGSPAEALPLVEATWILGRAGDAFPVVAFETAGGEPQRVWALYPEATPSPMQPKPSQFTGRLLAALPDGTPLPEGAHIYHVDAFTAGCSSKFLPPETAEKYQAEYGSLDG